MGRIEPARSRAWIIRCRHPDYPNFTIDLSEFADGAETPSSRRGAHLWLGKFGGRPGLLDDLMPSIIALFGGRPPVRLKFLKGVIRGFWRFLDAYEAWVESRAQFEYRIDRLHHVTGVILELFSQPGPDDRWTAAHDSHLSVMRTLILDAVNHHELPVLSVSSHTRRRATPRDPPSHEEGLSIIRYLRGEVASIFRRWQRADMLARDGRDLIAICAESGGRMPSELQATEADAHATFRALANRLGHPLPSIGAFYDAIPQHFRRKQLPKWWPRYDERIAARGRLAGDLVSWSDCIAGAYPTSQDVATCALLCIARSAWNPGTLLNIEIDDWWNSYDQDHAWIYAKKDRAAGSLQHTISAKSHPTGIYRIVLRLIERNAPLRSWISENPESIPTPELALRSPWLGSSNKPSDLIFVADPRNTATLNGTLKTHVAGHNAQPEAKIQVRPISSSDFRDIAAAIMYKESRYNMWVLMLMLGHRSIATTRIYGYSRAGRQESHQLVSQVVSDMFDQALQTRRWDPALARARIEGIPVTSVGLQHLEEYRKTRTYSGAICKNPFDPPTNIDPGNPKDGRSRCVQGHLCVARGCPQGIVLNDSLADICKTVAELEWRRTHTGTVRFSVGSEEQDLFYLQETLKQWPAAKVAKQLALWRERIARGEHKPILYAGQH